MKLILGVAAGLLVGFIAGWSLSRTSFRHVYKTTKELELLGSEGSVVAKLPAGTPLLTNEKLLDEPDLGWWAFAAIQFDTMRTAKRLGVVPGSGSDLLAHVKFRANSNPTEGPPPATEHSP